MSRPVVKVIAHTKFLGFPEELYPKSPSNAPDLERVKARHQDEGSDLARLVECAGRTCYDSLGAGRSSEAYHQHILEAAHGSVLEHASITFFISGVSRGLTHELVRHRHAAISQRSTRYCDESESDWAWHPLVAELRQQSSGTSAHLEDVEDAARNLYDRLVDEIQRHLVNQGVDKLAARKQARGAARGALGNALSTELVWTVNLRALRGVLEQRCSEFADAEIRLLFNEVYRQAKEVCPEFLSDYEEVPCADGLGFSLKTRHRKI